MGDVLARPSWGGAAMSTRSFRGRPGGGTGWPTRRRARAASLMGRRWRPRVPAHAPQTLRPPAARVRQSSWPQPHPPPQPPPPPPPPPPAGSGARSRSGEAKLGRVGRLGGQDPHGRWCPSPPNSSSSKGRPHLRRSAGRLIGGPVLAVKCAACAGPTLEGTLKYRRPRMRLGFRGGP